MIDIVSPDERFSVSTYKKQAEEKIAEVLGREKTPILVGRNRTVYRKLNLWNRV